MNTRVVINFHECWVLSRGIVLNGLGQSQNVVQRNVFLPCISAESESHVIELTGLAVAPPVLPVCQHAALLVFLDGLKLIL